MYVYVHVVHVHVCATPAHWHNDNILLLHNNYQWTTTGVQEYLKAVLISKIVQKIGYHTVAKAMANLANVYDHPSTFKIRNTVCTVL